MIAVNGAERRQIFGYEQVPGYGQAAGVVRREVLKKIANRLCED
jgi:hypothetical protein